MTQFDELRNMAEAIKDRKEFKVGDIVKVKDVLAPHIERYGYLKGIITDIDKEDNHSCIVSFLGDNGYLSDEIVDCGILELLKIPVHRYKVGDIVKVHQIRRFNSEDAYSTDLLGFIKEIDYSLRAFPYLISVIGPNTVGDFYYDADKLWHVSDEDIDHEATAKLNSGMDKPYMEPEVFTECGDNLEHPWGVSVGDLVSVNGEFSTMSVGIVSSIDLEDPCLPFAIWVSHIPENIINPQVHRWMNNVAISNVTILKRNMVDIEAIHEIIRKTNTTSKKES